MTGAMLAETLDALEHLQSLTDPDFIPTVDIYTDGACSGNPGPGGWGAVICYQSMETDLSGGDPTTTNNRMEMMAAIRALQSLPRRCQVNLYTDSMYVRDGVTRWMENWKKNGWKTSDKKPVKNQDLWLELNALLSRHEIHWHGVKGHDGVELNERADALARNAIIAQRMKLPN